MVYPNPQIYPHLQVIFVHVPKTAGTSIERALLRSPDQVVGGHTTALGYRRKFPTEFADYFKFAVVRHPLTRFLSAYRYLRERPVQSALNNVGIHECGTFEHWMSNVREHPELLDGIVHLQPQHRFVCDERGEVLLDRIYRYEALDVAWADISGRLGIQVKPLARLNASKAATSAELTTDWIVQWIAESYAEDFRLGDYRPDSFELATT